MPASSRPAAGGGRWLEVAPERLARWVAGVAAGHGPLLWSPDPGGLLGRAADGTTALLTVPFPPPVAPLISVDDVVVHSVRPRRVGVLLVRLGGHAAGIFDGTTLVRSKVGRRQVHGRSAAGGWSQQRFARRREGQVRLARQAAADLAAAVLLPGCDALEAMVLGGERTGAMEVLGDPRLAPLRPLLTGLVLDVPDPRLRVLAETPARFRAVRVLLVEPPPVG